MGQRIFRVICAATISLAANFLSAGFSYSQQEEATVPAVNKRDCAEIVKSCLSGAMAERTTCLFSVSADSSCQGSKLGELAYRRASLSPERHANDANQEKAPAAQFVDRECLTNFDNELSSSLILGVLSEESIVRLMQRLEDCKLDSPLDVSRP